MPSSASAPSSIYTLSLHDALPIYPHWGDFGPKWQASVIPDAHSFRAGVTTFVDAGTSGADHFEDFKSKFVDKSRTRVLAFVNIAHRSEEHTSELQSRVDLVCRLLLPRPPPSTLFPYTTLFRSTPTGATSAPSGRPASSPTRTPSGPASPPSSTPARRARITSRTSRVSSSTSPAPACLPSSTSPTDRKSTRLNSSHEWISYAVFCFRALLHLHSFPTRRSSDLPPLGRLRPQVAGQRHPRRALLPGRRHHLRRRRHVGRGSLRGLQE